MAPSTTAERPRRCESARSAPALVAALGSLIGAALLWTSCGCQRAQAWAEREPAPVATRATLTSPPHPAPEAPRAALPPALAPGAELDLPPEPKQSLEARYTERRVPRDGVLRVYAKTRNVWIREEPTVRSQWIGYLWFGGAVEVRDPKPIIGWGCDRFYAVKPRGYVCVDEERATVDPSDPAVQALLPLSPDASGQDPHPFYGESIDTPRYHELPSPTSMARREPEFNLHQERVSRALWHGETHDSLFGLDLSAAVESPPTWPAFPNNVRELHKHLVRGSAVAWTREFNHQGRTFLLTDDLSWVPKDRVRPLPRVEFSGVHLGAEIELPLAFFRDEVRPRFQRQPDGSFAPTGQVYERLSWVQLTGAQASAPDSEYLETRNGDWVRSFDAVVPTPRPNTPWNAPVGRTDTTGHAPKGRATWLQVSLRGGWLIAYEGTSPKFVTLVSAGRGGPPRGSRPVASTASTPTGWYRITGKFVTSTMIAPDQLVHSAVPWAQNFSGPYSLHSAYWHDGWGYGKSGGCINLSPADSFFLFHFTEPSIPAGWHGLRWSPELEEASWLLIEKGPYREGLPGGLSPSAARPSR